MKNEMKWKESRLYPVEPHITLNMHSKSLSLLGDSAKSDKYKPGLIKNYTASYNEAFRNYLMHPKPVKPVEHSARVTRPIERTNYIKLGALIWRLILNVICNSQYSVHVHIFIYHNHPSCIITILNHPSCSITIHIRFGEVMRLLAYANKFKIFIPMSGPCQRCGTRSW